MIIGFIGQGWIGKNYANDFEQRGHSVVRYSKEPEYVGNKEKIKECDIVFVAVPTPTTPEGFDATAVRDALSNVGKGKTAVIKSTITPGVTESLQKEYPDIFVLHSPEFLSEATAAYDAAHPQRNIVGMPVINSIYEEKAQAVLDVLPHAPYEKICGSLEAEFIKYGRNVAGFVRVIFVNLLYDLVQEKGGDWSVVREALAADPDNGPTYMNPVHKTGRGAGGHCFIKDFAAFRRMYEEAVGDKEGVDVLEALEQKNITLLTSTHKDLDLLRGVYGENYGLKKTEEVPEGKMEYEAATNYSKA